MTFTPMPQFYSVPGLYETPSEQTPTKLVVDALAFYSGEHTDSSGKVKTYSDEDIGAIVSASNKRLSKGQRCKLFTDHEYKQRNVIGRVPEPFTLAEISADRLPHPGMTELVGRMGAFCKVLITGSRNVQEYLDGNIKELSVGIDPSGRFAKVRNAIYEISCVGFPALEGAALYEAEEPEDDRLEELSDRISELEQKFEQTQEQEQEQPMSETPETYTPQADGVTMEQYTALQSQLAELQQQNAQFERKYATAQKFSQLRDKAIALRDNGKLTPAEFGDLFAEDKLETYASEGSQTLAFIAFHLEQLEKYATPVRFGLATDNEPLQRDEDDSIDKTVDWFMKKYAIPKLY